MAICWMDCMCAGKCDGSLLLLMSPLCNTMHNLRSPPNRLFAQYLVHMKLRPIDPADLIAASGGKVLQFDLDAYVAAHLQCPLCSDHIQYAVIKHLQCSSGDCRVWRGTAQAAICERHTRCSGVCIELCMLQADQPVLLDQLNFAATMSFHLDIVHCITMFWAAAVGKIEATGHGSG